jgi:hypothetical protein
MSINNYVTFLLLPLISHGPIHPITTPTINPFPLYNNMGLGYLVPNKFA